MKIKSRRLNALQGYKTKGSNCMRLDVRAITLLVCIVTVHAAPVHAQRASHERDAHEIAESIRTRLTAGLALSLLTQSAGSPTQSERDAIADTLANLAISYPGSDMAAFRIRWMALEVLASASTTGHNGIPYAGGGQRLFRIVRESPQPGDRAGALSAISTLPRKEETLTILKEVATSQNRVARLAITLLLTEMGQPGLEILEDLYRAGSITEPRARIAIEALAKDRKWADSQRKIVGSQSVQRTDTTAKEAAFQLRTHGHARHGLDLLTQVNGPQPREVLDEIADTLAQIAITFPGSDLRAFQIRSAARTTLLLAGISLTDSGAEGVSGSRRIPYEGSAQRLMRIVTDAQDVGLRGGTLQSLPQVLDKSRLLPFLRQVVTSQNSAAFEAMVMLNEQTGMDGVEMLHDLYQQRLITEPNVQDMLRRIRWARGWTAPVAPVQRK